MFWIVMSLGALALTFVKLGAYLVLAKVLVMALFGALLVIAGLVVALVWSNLADKRPR